MYRGKRTGGYTRTANVSGKLKTNPETGSTIVTGEAKLNTVNAGILIVGIILFVAFVLFAKFPLFLVLFAVAALGHAAYSMYLDYSNLLKVIHEL